MLRVERQRAVDAIKAAENQQAQKIGQPAVAQFKTYAGTGPFAPIVMDAIAFPPTQQSVREPAAAVFVAAGTIWPKHGFNSYGAFKAFLKEYGIDNHPFASRQRNGLFKSTRTKAIAFKRLSWN
jgi:hypothetical protein